jgi:hypothetical protein
LIDGDRNHATTDDDSVLRSDAGRKLHVGLFSLSVRFPHGSPIDASSTALEPRMTRSTVSDTPRLVLELYAHATTEADRAAADLMGARLFGDADVLDARRAP